MFRLSDILTIATQIEKNGEATYRQAADNATDPELARIFLWMADEERRHGKWFASLAADIPVAQAHKSLEEMGRTLLQEMVADQTFSLTGEELEKTDSFGQLLNQSREFEEDTVLFYQFLRDLIDDRETARQLEMIIDEERQHARQLAELGDQLTAGA